MCGYTGIFGLSTYIIIIIIIYSAIIFSFPSLFPTEDSNKLITYLYGFNVNELSSNNAFIYTISLFVIYYLYCDITIMLHYKYSEYELIDLHDKFHSKPPRYPSYIYIFYYNLFFFFFFLFLLFIYLENI